jgi:hypothetical protein
MHELSSREAHLKEIRDAWLRHSEAEVTNVSKHGFWLLLGDEALAVPFSEFPWFKSATIEQLADVQRPAPGHFFWPQLDVDLAVESIRDPSAFPMVCKPTD